MPIEKFVGVVYGGSVVLGLTGGAACYYLCAEAAATTLAGETGTELVESANTLNKIIGGPQRELLKEFFQSGKVPEGLSQRTLRIYKQIAQRAISAGKDQLGVQAQRIQNLHVRLLVEYARFTSKERDSESGAWITLTQGATSALRLVAVRCT